MSISLESLIKYSELKRMEKEESVSNKFDALYSKVRVLEPCINSFYLNNKNGEKYSYSDLKNFMLLVKDIYNGKRVGECKTEYDLNSINDHILDNFPELKLAFKNYLKAVNE